MSNIDQAVLDNGYGPMYDQVIECTACNAKFCLKARREVRYCPYCSRDCKAIQTTLEEAKSE